jgi:hypothetical protein
MDRLHFQRFRILALPWFAIYLHRILRSDQDRHFHDHPWSFLSIILWRGYTEQWVRSPNWGDVKTRKVQPGSIVYHHYSDAHKITLAKENKSTWTLVFVGRRERDNWGYQTENGWMDHWLYRQVKRNDWC